MENEIEQRLRELAVLANVEHRAFVGAFQDALERAIRAGELLAQAKEHRPYSTWQRWLEENFEGSVRRAQEYMRLYNNRDRVRAIARDSAHLSIDGALKELASPRDEPATISIVHESEGVDPERTAGPTEFILERSAQPSPEPPPTNRMNLLEYRTAEPEVVPRASQQQAEATEKSGGQQQINYVSRVIDLVENDLFDHSNEELIEQLGHLRYLLNELDL